MAPVTCTTPPANRPDDKTWSKPPPQVIKAGDTTAHTITFTTNCGPIVISVDAAKAPVTANSMIFLTAQKFFNDTSCHRLTTQGIYVLQCGDPKGTGTGGPGYSIPDENLPKAGANNYPVGTVAMANSGANTNGSQFFLVYQNTTLPPSYTIWGTITSGLDVVQGIAAQGVKGGAGDGAPAQPVSILTGTNS
jgi:peptidyl-prolyl cis-trans isomerase B (cyclophilin B)